MNMYFFDFERKFIFKGTPYKRTGLGETRAFSLASVTLSCAEIVNNNI